MSKYKIGIIGCGAILPRHLESIAACDDFELTVTAETFNKLIAKTTKEEVELIVNDRYLEVKGNGKYKLELPVNEEGDPTHGKGIGKPFRSRGGGAVYVRSAKGNVIKVNFSQSGMRKRFNEPARVKSFVARHNCYGNKDKTSASYWACRWPRYFSDTGQQWW